MEESDIGVAGMPIASGATAWSAQGRPEGGALCMVLRPFVASSALPARKRVDACACVRVPQTAHQRVAGPLTDYEVRVVGEAMRWMFKKKTWTFICTHLLPYRQPQPASARWRAHEKAHGRKPGKAGVPDSPQHAGAVLQTLSICKQQLLQSHRGDVHGMLFMAGHNEHGAALHWSHMWRIVGFFSQQLLKTMLGLCKCGGAPHTTFSCVAVIARYRAEVADKRSF